MQRRLFRVEEFGRNAPVRVSAGQDDAVLRHSEIMEQFRALRSLQRAQRPENDELQLLRADGRSAEAQGRARPHLKCHQQHQAGARNHSRRQPGGA